MINEIDEERFHAEVLASELPVLVDFGAAWCGPCLAMDPVVSDIAATLHGRMRFFKVDVDRSPALATRYAIRSMPTVIIFRNGEPVDVQVGAGRPRSQLLKWMEGFI